MIRSGGLLPLTIPNKLLASGRHGSIANLSTVPITRVGGSSYIASSTTVRGRPCSVLKGQSGSSHRYTTREGLPTLIYPLTFQAFPALTGPMTAPHQGQARTINLFSLGYW